MSTRSFTLTRPQSFVGDTQTVSNASTAAIGRTCVMEAKSVYQADQQAKFLNLQAEVDSLLQQLQMLKEQRLTSGDEAITSNKAGESER